MGQQVLIIGRLRPDLGVSGTHEGVPVADVRHPDAVQDAIGRLAGDGDTLLVLCGLDDAAEIRRQLALVSLALPHVTTVLEPMAGSPLAVAAVATLVNDPSRSAGAAGEPDPAAQLRTLDTLREQIWSAVWLPSVSRLSTPAPSLGQHVRSWFGGPGFLAVHGDDARVVPCRGTTLPDTQDAPPGGVLMVADSGAPAWVVPAAMQAVGATSRIDYPSWRDPRDAFGVSACVELVVLPGDLDEAGATGSRAAADPAVAADSEASRECPGCGRRHHRPVCPYCRMVRVAPPDAPGTRPEPDRSDPAAGIPAPENSDDDLQGAQA
ncbi:hypothetical protein [Nocardioides mesophilus]|uniref:Uncharacterized protein n=1 Tax=Nocardioides mesophilus TaxID=433659 RepID=A0A7G9REX8_9ACTN|nr:hypothetical protein [Nocardioides mesophilus]QNN54153.1 hypothetical protein H9L09_07255 [Nocardioides mesophilus]